MEHDLRYISIILGMINELLRNNYTEPDVTTIILKYMNELQKEGCKLRMTDGYIRLIDYHPPKNNIMSKL